MILQPAIIALLVSSLLISLLVIYSAWHAFRIFRKWDIQSGSELQLELERRTYLVSTIVTYVLAFQILSLFLFIYTADKLCTLFTGAMCAAGTLAVNGYGYPVLILKILNFFLAGLWLVLNHVDGKAPDYPLVRRKYLLLLLIAPFLAGETILQTSYFIGLKPDIITSCCGSLFSERGTSVAADIAAFPAAPVETAFFLTASATVVAGVVFFAKGKGGYLFAALNAVLFFVTAASMLSFIPLYVYELPTHHCPFCLLQREYHSIGYVLYATLFAGTLSGMGVGILAPFRSVLSLAAPLPAVQKKLALLSVVLVAALIALVTAAMLTSNLKLA